MTNFRELPCQRNFFPILLLSLSLSLTLCPAAAADYGRFPYVSSFHVWAASHLHVGEYSCKTRSLRAEVEERIYLYVNDQART